MRKGYAIKFQGNGLNANLVCPAGGNLAWMEKLINGSYYVECRFTSKEPQKIIESDLPNVMDAWAEEHYRLTTTRHQRFHDWLNRWADYPIVKLIGIVAAIVAAAASVLALIG